MHVFQGKKILFHRHNNIKITMQQRISTGLKCFPFSSFPSDFKYENVQIYFHTKHMNV